jgi:hypothetical protein
MERLYNGFKPRPFNFQVYLKYKIICWDNGKFIFPNLIFEQLKSQSPRTLIENKTC